MSMRATRGPMRHRSSPVKVAPTTAPSSSARAATSRPLIRRATSGGPALRAGYHTDRTKLGAAGLVPAYIQSLGSTSVISTPAS